MGPHPAWFRLASGTTLLLLAVFGSLAVSSGCSGSTGTVPVTGTLTYQGNPLAEAIVAFTPVEGGRPAMGETDSSGRFELTAYTPGEHLVTVQKFAGHSASQDDMYAKMQSVIPVRYSDVQQSDLRASVEPRGTNHFELELSD